MVERQALGIHRVPPGGVAVIRILIARVAAMNICPCVLHLRSIQELREPELRLDGIGTPSPLSVFQPAHHVATEK